MSQKSWKEFSDFFLKEGSNAGSGRTALRRSWKNLRSLAASCGAKIKDEEIFALLGKSRDQLDPEKNDLKALVSYCVGKGISKGNELISAIAKDVENEPLAFLAEHSGKSFGEKWAPMFAKFWLFSEGDGWEKRKATDYFDIGWTPKETGKEIRIELKASSENPNFRFQQIRHPKMHGKKSEYEMVLCIGVTAGSLEWWAIPTEALDFLADNGKTKQENVVIVKHHGKKTVIWNEDVGFEDEGWFLADERNRKIIQEYAATSERIREKILDHFLAT